MQQNHIYTTYEIQKTPTKKKVLIISIIIFGSLCLSTAFGLVGFLLGRGSKSASDQTQIDAPSLFKEFYSDTDSDPSNLSSPSIGLISPTMTDKVNKGSPTPSKIAKSSVITSEKTLDGYITSTGTVSNSVEIKIGRNKYLVNRGFVSFDITKIPHQVTIQEAILRIYQVNTSGNPFDNLGNITIDHLNYGDKLTNDDYSSPAILSSFLPLSKNSKLGWREINVTPHLLDDISNARSTSQFRIHFEKEVKGDDVSGDFVYFESADNTEGTSNIPQLVVKYN